MEEIQLTAERRTLIRKRVGQLRAQGLVPGVLYGQGMEPEHLQFAERELGSLLHRAGMTRLVRLQIGSEEQKRNVLVRDIQLDVIRRTPLHVDLLQVAMDEKLTTETGIVLVGHAPAGCYVVQALNSVVVECLPGDLISTIEVDLSMLSEPGDVIRLRDLAIPSTVTVLADEDEVVAHAVEITEEVVEPVAPVALPVETAPRPLPGQFTS